MLSPYMKMIGPSVAPDAGLAGAQARRLVAIAGVLGFAMLTAVGAHIKAPLPFTPVPMTMQTAVVLMAGVALGARLGLLSQVVYLTLGALGYSAFAGEKETVGGSGWVWLIGDTGGYLMAFPLAAWLSGRVSRRFEGRIAGAVLGNALGVLSILAAGVFWLALRRDGDWNLALRLGLYPFVLAECLKLLLAALCGAAGWRYFRRVWQTNKPGRTEG